LYWKPVFLLSALGLKTRCYLQIVVIPSLPLSLQFVTRIHMYNSFGSIVCPILWNENQLMSLLFVYCWVSTCFGPTGPSSGDFVQLFTQPLVQCLSALDACSVWQHREPVGPKHVETQQYTNKIVTSVGFHSIR